MRTEIDKGEVNRISDLPSLLPEDSAPRRVGADKWMAKCPFHNEKTASFSMARIDGVWLWNCFGCHESGDLISFVMRTQGLSFPDALRRLAGAEAEAYRPGPAKPVRGVAGSYTLACNATGCGERVDIVPRTYKTQGKCGYEFTQTAIEELVNAKDALNERGWGVIDNEYVLCPKCREGLKQ